MVEVSDTAAHLQALTAAQITALPGIGVTELLSTNTHRGRQDDRRAFERHGLRRRQRQGRIARFNRAHMKSRRKARNLGGRQRL